MFQLNLPVYQGPLDLLLQLIERRELDITVVSLVQVTEQFLGYMRATEHVDAEALAEFVRIAARLIYIKSIALLPRSAEGKEEAEEETPDRALAQMLVEYHRFKQVAEALQQMEEQRRHVYPRLAPPPAVPPPLGLEQVTPERLLQIFREVITRRRATPEPAVIERENFTVEQKIETILRSLQETGELRFHAFVASSSCRVEVIVSLLALLELLKAGRVVAQQEELFGDIVVLPTPPQRRARRR